MTSRWRCAAHTGAIAALLLASAVNLSCAEVSFAADVYSDEQYVIGIGRGDLSKGPVVCPRVAELAARADVAKQIRVLITEHIVDRVRERSGKPVEQDIEVVQEEEVREVLRDIRIIERTVDTSTGVCLARAALRRERINGSTPQAVVPSTGPAPEATLNK
jgi:hypothetical protein